MVSSGIIAAPPIRCVREKEGEPGRLPRVRVSVHRVQSRVWLTGGLRTNPHSGGYLDGRCGAGVVCPAVRFGGEVCQFHQRGVIDPTEQTPFRRVLQSYKLAHFQALATPQKNFRTSRLTLAIDSAIFQASHLAPLHLRPRC